MELGVQVLYLGVADIRRIHGLHEVRTRQRNPVRDQRSLAPYLDQALLEGLQRTPHRSIPFRLPINVGDKDLVVAKLTRPRGPRRAIDGGRKFRIAVTAWLLWLWLPGHCPPAVPARRLPVFEGTNSGDLFALRDEALGQLPMTGNILSDALSGHGRALVPRRRLVEGRMGSVYPCFRGFCGRRSQGPLRQRRLLRRLSVVARVLLRASA